MKCPQILQNFIAGCIIYTILSTYVLGSLVCFLIPFVFFPAKYAVFIMIGTGIFYRIRFPCEFNGSWEIKSFRKNFIYDFLLKTLPWDTIFTSDLNPESKYMFVCCPHGMWPISWLLFLSHLANNNMYPLPLIHDMLFRLPYTREMSLLLGGVNANWKSVQASSEKDRSLFNIPGSAREMAYSGKTKDTIIVVKRKGFIKAAIEYGYSLVPVIGVGVDDLYQPYVFEWGWYKRLFGHYMFITMGEYELFYPKKTTVHHVVGEPIHVVKIETPSEEQITELSAKFYQGLETALSVYNEKYEKDIKLEYAQFE